MCFSNLPVEFDEDGNPYLAEEAEAVDRPGESDHAGCDCGADAADAELAADPEGAYEAIVASLPEGARDRVAEEKRPTTAEADAAGGD